MNIRYKFDPINRLIKLSMIPLSSANFMLKKHYCVKYQVSSSMGSTGGAFFLVDFLSTLHCFCILIGETVPKFTILSVSGSSWK